MMSIDESGQNSSQCARKLEVARRKILALGGTLAMTTALGTGAAGQTTPAPSTAAPVAAGPEPLPSGYNILLIVVDQERFFDPYPFPVPGRERLMKRGTTFLHHENCANVCTSSRSVLYTGWHMPKTGLFDNFGLPWMTHNLDPALGTLGMLMRQAGYYSAYKGKWHMSDEFDAVVRNDGKIDLGLQPTPEMHKAMERYGFSDYHGIGDVIGWSQGGYLYDSVTTGQTVNWLRGAGQSLSNSGTNWFLALNLVNPHDVMFVDTDEQGQKAQWKGGINNGGISMNPAQPPDNAIYRATWDDVPLPGSRHQPFDERGRPEAHREYQRARAVLVGDFPDEDRRWRKLQNYYFNCIRDCDLHVVRILDELDRLNLSSKTIVVFTADHGELGGHHQMHGKGSSVYSQQMHVPFIIVHPAYPGGQRCNALTNHLDIAPTVLGLAGLDPDRRKAILGERAGKDLSALLAEPSRAPVHAVRESSLYCFGMMLYMDADYLAKVQAARADKNLTEAGRIEAVGKLQPNFSKRAGIRCVNDGRYKFARYFSLREHNTPRTMQELLAHNDIELFDLSEDPDEMHNLAVDASTFAAKDKRFDLIMGMSDKLNALIAREIGTDDGSYLPNSGMISWHLAMAVE